MEPNGEPVIRIGRKGRRKVAFGEDGKVFEVDVIQVVNAYAELDRAYRNEQGEVSADKLAELNLAAWNFVRELAQEPAVTLAEAMEFLAQMTREAKRLKAFFDVDSGDGPSSPAPTELTFST